MRYIGLMCQPPGDACQQGERQPEGIEDRASDKPADDTTADE
jgi:hypothetical protein